jgi:hypothetical protein
MSLLLLPLLAALTGCSGSERSSETPESPPADDADSDADDGDDDPQAANNRRSGEPEPDEGLWNRAREAPTLDEEIAQLEAIGYTGGDELASTSNGITVYDPERAHDGINFWVSGHGPEATLMDMDGTVLHRWAMSYDDAFPGGERYFNHHGAEFWRRAHLFPNGDILAIFEGHGLVKIDKDNEVVWRWDGRAHHDLEVLPDGRIWVLSRKGSVIERVNPRRPVLEDFAVLLSPAGEVLEEISLLEALEKSDGKNLLYKRKRRRGDIFHTNSIEVLDGRAEQENPAFKAGNLLISMRTLSAIMVVDPTTGATVWWHTGAYKKQHDPKILANGHLMLYDNLGYRGRSAVREYRVSDMKQMWVYGNSTEEPFYSRFTGAAYRFPNGNTLIAESGFGRVFEKTADGDTVWEYHNPNRAGDEGQFVAIIPDLIRYPRDYATFLDPQPERPAAPAATTPEPAE